MSDVPDDLGDAGRALYRRVLDDLDDGLTFDALELERLHGAAKMADRLAEVRASITEHGLWVDSPKGSIPNPLLIREESMQKSLAGLLAKLTVARPEPKTRHLSRAQRNRLRDANARGLM
jgi:hypothetical protein